MVNLHLWHKTMSNCGSGGLLGVWSYWFCFFMDGKNVNNFEKKTCKLLPMYVCPFLISIKMERKLLAPLQIIETQGYHKGQWCV